MDYTVIDLEMTGLSVKTDKIIEIGAIRVRGGEIVDSYGTIVNPRRPVPQEISGLTGITDEMAAVGEEEDAAVSRLLEMIGGDVLVGHNVSFDYRFLKQWAVNHGIKLELAAIDTLRMARTLLPPEQSKKLESLCEYFQIPRANAHRALEDAKETQQIFELLYPLAVEKAPELLVPKTLVFHTKKQVPATPRQIERLVEFRERHRIADEICWETLSKSEASRLQEKYYSVYGRA
ncbi:MAG: 3'-5' exonuclease [Muribaculaceae bacterium]|nr:3'-5' exonuclease [Roseburia sp.]MCM1431624.1 3'-5' exonuclease [Muribaculaceae bacterium]MCM1492089.1 3'-5' exonuclease [Muribaculaceae bacterium]